MTLRTAAQALDVFTKEVEYKEAMKIKSIRAVFNESYPKFVRVVTIGRGVDDMLADPTNAEWSDFSVELCGGTHVANTSVAKKFAIMNVEAISKGVRRISGGCLRAVWGVGCLCRPPVRPPHFARLHHGCYASHRCHWRGGGGGSRVPHSTAA